MNRHPLVRKYSAAERAAVVEREISELVDSGRFVFTCGKGRLNYDFDSHRPCGCAVGAILTVTGERGDAAVDQGCFDQLEATGLVTQREMRELEQGYEFGRTAPGAYANDAHRKSVRRASPFFEVGCRLRARPDARPYWRPKAVGE